MVHLHSVNQRVIPQLFIGAGGIGEMTRFGHADLATTAAANNPGGLDGWGWSAPSETITEGALGDFVSPTDITPTYVQPGIGTATPLERDGNRFGGYADALQAYKMLGAMPNLLVCEFMFKMVDVTKYSTIRRIGLDANSQEAAMITVYTPDGGATRTFYIYSDGLVNTGIAADELWHVCRFDIRATGLDTWFDGVLIVEDQTLNNDCWPASFRIQNQIGVDASQVQCAWYDVHWEVE